MDIGAWWTTVHGVAKVSGMTYQLSNNDKVYTINIPILHMWKLSSEKVKWTSQKEQHMELQPTHPSGLGT